MSTVPFHFQTQPFTSTLHDNLHKSPVNLWLIMVTAFFFFLILSVYNLALAIYNYVFNPRDRETDELRDELIATLGFVFFWGVLAVTFYLFLDSIGYLGDSSEKDIGHPLLKDDVRDITESMGGRSDVLGTTDIAGF